MDNFRNNMPSMESTSHSSKDMTQRVRLDGSTPNQSRPTSPQRKRTQKRWFMTRKEKITLISLASAALVLLAAAFILVGIISKNADGDGWFFKSGADDGLIYKGVKAAGVNLSGMTIEEATMALENATADTYTKLNMVVSVLDTKISLSPRSTGAKLDVAAVVQDAYNYGRTGTRSEQKKARDNALANTVSIPITPHLNLNTEYIRSEIDKLGTKFSSTLTQPKIELKGTKPQMGVPKPDTTQVHQTLTIYVGTAEYGLDTNKLFNQVLECYNSNIFEIKGECTVHAPDSLEAELLAYYEDLCVAPVDAQIAADTSIIPEVYGYGFNLDAVKEQIAKAPYGTTLNIPLCYLEPNLTEDLLSGALFKDILGAYTSDLGTELSWNSNVALACEKLNGIRLKSGESISFNELLGELTKENGYLEALAYQNRVLTSVMGGGVTHVASVLYNCVLQAELEILEHHNHVYAPSFIAVGRDAYVNYGTADFSFRNNGPDPICIQAEVVDGQIQIRIMGTDNRDYEVKLKVKTIKTIRPGKLYNIMSKDNPDGLKNNDELVPGINGYEIELYKTMYKKSDGQLKNENFISTYTYSAQDAVLVKLVDTTTPDDSTDPNTPNTPLNPDSSENGD